MCDVVFAGAVNVSKWTWRKIDIRLIVVLLTILAGHAQWHRRKSDIYQLTCTSRMLRLARQMTRAQQVSISMKSNSKCSVNIPHSPPYVYCILRNVNSLQSFVYTSFTLHVRRLCHNKAVQRELQSQSITIFNFDYTLAPNQHCRIENSAYDVRYYRPVPICDRQLPSAGWSINYGSEWEKSISSRFDFFTIHQLGQHKL